LKNLNAWMELLEMQPACQRGTALSQAVDSKQMEADMAADDSGINTLVIK
jgi:hypothetical protein